MSEKPNLTIMSKSELRAYMLQHRDNEEALHVYLDKVHTENPNSQIYSPETNVGDILAQYLGNQKQ
jgi:hypothetical protein